MNKVGGSTEVFAGFANPAIINYLAQLDRSAADSSADLSAAQEDIDNIANLLAIAQQDINAAELDIVDLQQRMIDEEGISVDLIERMVVEEGISIDLTGRMVVEEGISIDLTGRMVVEEGLSVDLQGRMIAEETISATHEAEITVLQDQMVGQQSAMDTIYRRSQLIGYPMNSSILGTVPLLVGTLVLPLGDYLPPRAYIGCALPSDTATLKIRDSLGTEIVAVGGDAGGPEWREAATGFTLTDEIQVELLLYASTETATAIVHGLKLEVI